MNEFVILVNRDDHVVGKAEKLFTHQHALLHRAFSIFLFRQQGKDLEILLQKRSPDKYHSGGLWTNTCCGHPRHHEILKYAAQRRLYEETRIRTELVEVGSFYYTASLNNQLTEKEIDHVFIGKYDGKLKKVNSHEVAALQWMNTVQLKAELKKKSETFTPWFKKALKVALPEIKQYSKNCFRSKLP